MNTHVDFEIAKLLKEKGFDEPCYNAYDSHAMQFSNGWLEYICDNETDIPFTKGDLRPQDTLAPIIAEVVMWLYEKHRIWIECLHRGDMGDFTYKVSKLKNNWKTEPHYIYENGYNSPTEAYQEAIDYTLKNLIK